MSKFKNLFLFLFLIILVIELSSPIILASSGEIAEQGQTWLAKQLEIYGVPAGISAVIGGLGVSGAIFLFTKGQRKSINKSTSEVLSVVKVLDITNSNAIKLTEEVKILINKTAVPILEKAIEMMALAEKTLDQAKTMMARSVAREDELYNLALKINKTLTEPIKQENVKEV